MDKASIVIAEIMRLLRIYYGTAKPQNDRIPISPSKSQLVAYLSADPASVIGLLGTLAEGRACQPRDNSRAADGLDHDKLRCRPPLRFNCSKGEV